MSDTARNNATPPATGVCARRAGALATRRAARPAPRRRGSIYAVVLAMAILVSLIGLSAVAVGRINLRTASAGGDAASAEVLALSGIEHAVAIVNADPSWRNNYVHDEPTAPAALGGGEFTWKLLDEIDLDLRLSNGGLQPVRVHATGRVGDARRAFSVMLVPSGPNRLLNAGFETGLPPYEASNCMLDVSSSAPHNGVRCLLVRGRADRSGGPAQDVKVSVNSGRWYYLEAWMKMSASVEEPVFDITITDSGLLGLLSSSQTFKARGQAVGLDWTKVTVALNPSFSGTPNNIYWHISTASTNQDFWVDDVKLIENASGVPMSPARETWRQEELN